LQIQPRGHPGRFGVALRACFPARQDARSIPSLWRQGASPRGEAACGKRPEAPAVFLPPAWPHPPENSSQCRRASNAGPKAGAPPRAAQGGLDQQGAGAAERIGQGPRGQIPAGEARSGRRPRFPSSGAKPHGGFPPAAGDAGCRPERIEAEQPPRGCRLRWQVQAEIGWARSIGGNASPHASVAGRPAHFFDLPCRRDGLWLEPPGGALATLPPEAALSAGSPHVPVRRQRWHAGIELWGHGRGSAKLPQQPGMAIGPAG